VIKILVTVGTHEQPFNRLVRVLDRFSKDFQGQFEVFIQYGYSDKPTYAAGEQMVGTDTLASLADWADIIITHGGPGSIWLALERKKIPIVVPRSFRFGEHVNDHQVAFARHMEREKRVIAIYDIDDLPHAIKNYKTLATRCKFLDSETRSNRKKVERLIDGLLK